MTGREAGGFGRELPADVGVTDCPGAMPGASTRLSIRNHRIARYEEPEDQGRAPSVHGVYWANHLSTQYVKTR